MDPHDEAAHGHWGADTASWCICNGLFESSSAAVGGRSSDPGSFYRPRILLPGDINSHSRTVNAGRSSRRDHHSRTHAEPGDGVGSCGEQLGAAERPHDDAGPTSYRWEKGRNYQDGSNVGPSNQDLRSTAQKARLVSNTAFLASGTDTTTVIEAYADALRVTFASGIVFAVLVVALVVPVRLPRLQRRT